jgi:hypothetical protein
MNAIKGPNGQGLIAHFQGLIWEQEKSNMGAQGWFFSPMHMHA